MYSFYQTWNLPGSSFFDYIFFSAKSRKEANEIGLAWSEWKASKEVSTSQIANGYQGSLVSLTKSKEWRWKSGEFIFNQESGERSYELYLDKVQYDSDP